MIKISAVSYANTYPFLLGLEHFYVGNDVFITKDVPAECARKLIENEVDVGLIPIAALPKLNSPRIISDYCIGAIGPVKTVVLLSKIPLEEIDTVYLDSESNTSVNLIKILAKFYWKKNWQYKPLPKNFLEKSEVNSLVLIGDKTQLKLPYNFVYDLSQEWYNFTQKPFVFAAWVANKEVPDDFIFRFNKSLSQGLSNIPKAIEIYNKVNHYDLNDYLTNFISFDLDENKKEAIDIYLNFLKQL